MRAGRAARWIALAGLAVVAAAPALSPSLRASLGAAWQAFRDPSLVAPRPALPPPELACRAATQTELRDADLARDFERADDDLDDPDGVALRSLTLPDLGVPITRRTMRFVKYFAKTERGRAGFLARTRRGAAYRPLVEQALREAGLPEDLVWVVAIESGFDPRAVSPAGAAGLWQLMPETGALYGLEQSPWVDDRRSLTRATAAAVAHLRDLEERLGRWDLALAAYNAGYTAITRAVDKLAQERAGGPDGRKPIGFADLAAARAIPDETAAYVPQIVAFAIVAANRSRFGLEALDLAPPVEIGEIAVPEGCRLRTIARAAGVSIGVLRDYNPELLRDRIPPTGGDWMVSVPADRVQRALAALPSYLDQEEIAGDDDALPPRPIAMPDNRLPAWAKKRAERDPTLASLVDTSVLGAKLAAIGAGAEIGWHPSARMDPLRLFGDAGAKAGGRAWTGEAGLDRALGFLDQAPALPLESATLSNGTIVEVRRDARATTAAVTLRLATADTPGAPRSEIVSTIVVPAADADTGIELAAARLRLEIAARAPDRLAELRARIAGPRQRALAQAPDGAAWLALGDALFEGEPLRGLVVGAREDPAVARDALLVDAMAREAGRARATLSIAGDVSLARARDLAQAIVGSVPLGQAGERDDDAARGERHVRVASGDSSERVLVGWAVPPAGGATEPALRVAVEVLTGPELGTLRKALVDRAGLATDVRAVVDAGAGAGVVAIEATVAPGRSGADVLHALDAELARLGSTRLLYQEVALARAFLAVRLEHDAAATPSIEPRGAAPARLRRALDPEAAKKLVEAVRATPPDAVRVAVSRVLAPDRRVVVSAEPPGVR